MEKYKWITGRQLDINYKKLCLWHFKIFNYGFDAYLLKYEPHTILKEHIDKVENGKHYRLNIELWGFSMFWLIKNGERKEVDRNVIFFRPDVYPHGVNVYGSGCLKLSLGFVKFRKNN